MATSTKHPESARRSSASREPAVERQARDERLDLRLTAELKLRLATAARLRDQSTTEFVLAASRQVADELLGERTRFVLSPEQMASFERALESAPRDLPGLRKLMARKSVLG